MHRTFGASLEYQQGAVDVLELLESRMARLERE
jgi:hypothetical protein